MACSHTAPGLPWKRPRCDAPITEEGVYHGYELGSGKIAALIDLAFGQMEEKWNDSGGSPHRKFYANASAMPTDRIIAWNPKRDFGPKHIFFRSVDTGRLLTMDNAGFRVQIWRRPCCDRTAEAEAEFMVLGMIHELMLLRNLHDLGAADIPFVACNLNQNELKKALDYWVWLSKEGNQSSPERAKRFNEIDDECQANNRNPCFLQIDLIVRKLLLQRGNHGLVAPFIILHSSHSEGGLIDKAQILFTRACAVPPKRLMDIWPSVCGALDCKNPDCGLVDMPRNGLEGAWVIDSKGGLTSETGRSGQKLQGERFCNHWPCRIKYGDGQKLDQCSKCKEVIYCSREHQRLDWKIHKDLCGTTARQGIDESSPIQLVTDGSLKKYDSMFDMYDSHDPSPFGFPGMR